MKHTGPIVKYRRKFIIQILIPVIISLCLLFTGYILTISYVRELLINAQKDKTKEMVKSVYNMVDKYYSLVNQGQLSEKQAKETINLSIKNLRYGNDSKDYYWIIDYQTHIVSHPYFTDSLLWLRVNYQYNTELKNLIFRARLHNEGFIEYNWQVKDDTTRVERKISYVKNFKPWNWVIGTGFYPSIVNNDIKNLIKYIFYVMLHLFLLLTILFFFIIRRAFYNVKQILKHENELILSERRFKGMAHNIDSGLIIRENDKIVFVNKKVCDIFGLSQEEFNDYNIYNFIVPEEKERFKLIIKESLNNNDPVKELSVWINTIDNKRKFIVNHFSYEKNGASEFTYILVSDITERKVIESKIKSLSETIEQSPDSILITDLNGNIEYVNKQFLLSSGYTYAEIIGEKPSVLKSGKMSPTIYVDLWKTITCGRIWEGELLNKKKNGELFWEQTIIFPIKNEPGEIINYAAIKTNLTKQKALEKELKRTAQIAKVSDKLKTAFLNNISHEVRTPLNAIHGFSQLLKNEFWPSNTAYECLIAIINNSEILLKLFESIMDYSMIESGDVMFSSEDIDLSKLLKKIITKYNTTLISENRENIVINLEIKNDFKNVVITADEKYLSQIFDIFISNAVKFTLKGQISIGFTIDYENITFYIKDTGIGIPPDEYKLIFDSFTHGNNLYVSLHKGTGLGLNIANRLLQLMGGKIWFESKENKGSVFYFSLPSVDVKNYTIGNTIIEEYPYINALRDKNILILEKNDEYFFYLQSMLKIQNLKISLVRTSDEALRLLETDSSFNLIIMNGFMSYNGQFNLARIIKNSFGNIPIIAMFNNDYKLNEEDLGTFDITLRKPFPKNVFYKSINDLICK